MLQNTEILKRGFCGRLMGLSIPLIILGFCWSKYRGVSYIVRVNVLAWVGFAGGYGEGMSHTPHLPSVWLLYYCGWKRAVKAPGAYLDLSGG